jgi:hypothetical protein
MAEFGNTETLRPPITKRFRALLQLDVAPQHGEDSGEM